MNVLKLPCIRRIFLDFSDFRGCLEGHDVDAEAVGEPEVGGHLDGASKEDVFRRNSDLGQLLHLVLVLAAELRTQAGQCAQDHGAAVATCV